MNARACAHTLLLCALCWPAAASADEAEVHYRWCLSHKRAGKLEAAQQACREAIHKRPDHAAAHCTLGNLQRAQNQLEPALQSFQRCRQLEAANSLGWAGEGAVLLRLGRHADAETALRQAVGLDPRDSASIGNLGTALRKQDKVGEAISLYKQALQSQPGDAELLNNLAVALRSLRRNEEAIAALSLALKQRPGDAALSGNLAKALRAEKRYAEAIGYYETALKGHPNDAGLWFDLAYSYEQTGKKDKALHAYRKHLALIRARDAKGAAHVEEVIKKLEAGG
jgi:Flp pilus assembly protein TadD